MLSTKKTPHTTVCLLSKGKQNEQMDCCPLINRRDQRGHCQHGSACRPCQTSPTREQTCATRAKEKREKTRGEKTGGEKTQREKTCAQKTRDSKTSSTQSPLIKRINKRPVNHLQAACCNWMRIALKPYQNL